MNYSTNWSKAIVSIIILLNSFGIPAFGQPNTLAEKEEWVDSIYDRITTAMGLIDRPALVVDPFGRSSVAAMHYQKHQIIVDEQFVDLCWSRFPDRAADAMAFVVGHELAHFKFQHHWGEEFASSYAITDIASAVNDAQAQLHALPIWETQADQVGGIFVYLAGFSPGDIAAPLLQSIYDTYGFASSMSGYPSLQDRMAIAQANDEKVNNWIAIYETANFATLAGAFEVADYCYSHVIQQGFTSREVLNNHAVALIQQALLGMDDAQVRFAYPVELDLATRLQRNSRGASEPEVLLAKARQRLMHATWVDPAYATGWLNLACVQSLLGNYDDAVFYADKAGKLAEKQKQQSTLANAKVMLGIHAALTGEEKNAQKWWKEAEKMGASLAAINLSLLEGDMDISTLPDLQTPTAPSVSIDGVVLATQWGEQPFLPAPILYGLRHLYVCVDLPASDLYFFQIKDAVGWVFHATRQQYASSLIQQVQIGSASKSLVKEWGTPSQILSAAQGEVWHYQDKAILVKIDTEQNISGWITYLKTR